MVIDLVLLKRALHRRRMPMREFFRKAKLSRIERACVLNGVCITSYAVARICRVLSCNQASILSFGQSEDAMRVKSIRA